MRVLTERVSRLRLTLGQILPGPGVCASECEKQGRKQNRGCRFVAERPEREVGGWIFLAGSLGHC